jgi:ATP-dependent Lon protease
MADPDPADQAPADRPTVEAEPVPADDRGLVTATADLPTEALVLPLSQRPIFPAMVLPLMIPPGRLAGTVRFAAEHGRGFLVLSLLHAPLPELSAFTFADLHPVGVIGRIIKRQDGEDGSVQAFCQILERFALDAAVAEQPFVRVRGRVLHPLAVVADDRVRAMAMAVVSGLRALVQHNPVFADEIKLVLANYNNLDGPGRLADLAASLTTARGEELQEVLATQEIAPRLEKVLALLSRETELAELKTRIQSQIEEKVSAHQRKFFLNEQLKAIKEELGIETDEKSLELSRLRQLVEAKRTAMPAEVISSCEDELRKLGLLEPASSEYGVARNRLEWLTALPWGEYTTDRLDLVALRAGLDRDHYGLEDVKDRIVEFCGVRALKRDRGGGIICLVGPPGTGKTSIGMSISAQLGRRFFRFSVGGLRDEAEIKGHRRTYVGALPGKLVQALRRCGSMNPVVLLDEIDKLSRGPQGDPASALLEVLDPEQNRDFLDHYIDARVDLSQVLFICTANDIGGIPEPLRDRMEIIRLAGYVEQEKLRIAARYLVPKQRAAHGLGTGDIAFSTGALRTLTRSYAREAGVRQAEQLIAKICRKVATAKATWEARRAAPEMAAPAAFARVAIGPRDLERFLGQPFIADDELLGRPQPGVVTGLAWTALGGATLEVEVVAIPATAGGITLTGQLGDVMKESANLAWSYLRSHAAVYGIAPDWFDRHHLHVHVPAGATPKDGPSAGITMAAAMLSLALGRPPRRRLGMTGELTLTGRVLPIGGVREKLVAARRSRLALVLLPVGNQRDYLELPDHLRSGLTVRFVADLAAVIAAAGLRPGRRNRR